MSYILDALKRAEAERERGAVPGLNAQPTPMASAKPERAAKAPLLWAMAALLALAGAVSFWWLGRSSAPVASSVVLATAPAVAPPAPAPAPIPAPPPTATAPVNAPIQPAAPAAVPTPPVAPAPPPAAAPTTTAAPAAKTVTPVASPAPVASVPAATKPVAAAPAAKLPTLNELPADVRGQLPKMTITGAVYSKDPSQRLLLINNQVFTQGGNVAPGLDLEEIQPHSAIFNFQGTRFAMPH